MDERFDFIETGLAGLTVVQRRPVEDARGYLERLYGSGIFGDRQIVQINRTLTASRGTVRGMHFQYPPHADTKLVTCLRGRVFDVAVDLRRGSPTFLHWHAEVLDGTGHRSLLIPDGFAHGFQTLCGDCEMLYLHTAPYEPSAEGALNALDPALHIDWPEPVTVMSDRDRAHPHLDERFEGLEP